jgi:2Fe-2S ferredoxin
MPTVVFERTGFRVDCPDGARIADLCDEHPRAGVPFSCRDANCGTCCVEVREGLELCEAPRTDERDLLEYLERAQSVRLACQLRVRPGNGVVRLWVTL